MGWLPNEARGDLSGPLSHGGLVSRPNSRCTCTQGPLGHWGRRRAWALGLGPGPWGRGRVGGGVRERALASAMAR